MRIGDQDVGAGFRPFVIAEMSGNHNGSLERALRIVDAAADAGASAVKLQTFTADSMTLDTDGPGFIIEEPESLWFGRRLYELYAEAATPWDWHRDIMTRAADRGLLCFSSPFDVPAVEFLDDLGVPCFKIASLENNDYSLIEAVAATGKPVIISSGASTLDELDEAVSVARTAGCHDLILLKCTSGYPTPAREANLRAIPMMRERYGCEVGLSDHSTGIGVAIAAIVLGATVIEKHVIDDREAGGIDSAFSLEPQELAILIEEADHAREALGNPELTPTESESGTRSRRRSLYVSKDVGKGERFTEENVRSIRPGYGLHPRHLQDVLGAVAAQDVSAGSPLAWTLIRRTT